MKIAIIIPARYASSRYPGKPLVELLGKPMILWVAELSAQAVGQECVYIATEDQRIYDCVVNAGFQAVMTSKNALTGTDRLAEAAKQVQADIYVNVQGDEPMVSPNDIQAIIATKAQYPNDIINGYTWVEDNEDPQSVNIPKVITNEHYELVYMSRAALPAYKDSNNKPNRYKKQVCIYAFTKQELEWFQNFGRKSYLEQYEDIEILRFLECGCKIRMVATQGGSLAVDVPQDVEKVENALKLKVKNG